MGGHLCDARMGRLFAIQTSRLQAIEGLVGIQTARKIVILEYVAANSVNTEERLSAAERLDWDERRPRMRHAFLQDSGVLRDEGLLNTSRSVPRTPAHFLTYSELPPRH